ncbi:hypothetical protein ETD83_36010 [Actinomadura soli]|uniref:Uncharacterized protein n=1 Tax=Actinomadura soli TaxID=2508997 RepID=A0A5C4J0W3_9ACTN|nr:hypothetical protein [Actinomadura soli]TMQ90308.1 hypothetical protein ETD83_36010 [Actinomadura soli]
MQVVPSALVEEQKPFAAAAVSRAAALRRGAGRRVLGEETGQERRQVDGAEVVRVVVAVGALLGGLELEWAAVRRRQLHVDGQAACGDVVVLQAHEFAPPQPAPGAHGPHDEVVVAAGQDGAPFGQQQRLQRGRPLEFLTRGLGAPLDDLAAASAAGGGVDVDQSCVVGVAEDRGEQIAGVVGDVAGVAAPQPDLPCLDLLPVEERVDGQVAEDRVDPEPQVLLIGDPAAVLDVLRRQPYLLSTHSRKVISPA